MNDGSYLPVFMPLLLAIVGLRPLPNYFVHACDYVDLKVVKEGGKAGSKPLTELLLQEYGSDLQGSAKKRVIFSIFLTLLGKKTPRNRDPRHRTA